MICSLKTGLCFVVTGEKYYQIQGLTNHINSFFLVITEFVICEFDLSNKCVQQFIIITLSQLNYSLSFERKSY
jgi:hypothetical protein